MLHIHTYIYKKTLKRDNDDVLMERVPQDPSTFPCNSEMCPNLSFGEFIGRNFKNANMVIA